MKCPFCEEAPPTEEDLEAHVKIKHPEKAELLGVFDRYKKILGEVQRETSRGKLYSLAATLTNTSIGAGGATGEIVLERFRYFVKELYSVFREG